jgi:hypothetical protein
VSVKASVRAQNGALELTGPLIDKPVVLAPLDQVEKIQFDRPTGRARAATADELAAYQRLLARYHDAGTADLPARVTGPLRQAAAGWTLNVCDFEA